jgi:hypothetical protein
MRDDLMARALTLGLIALVVPFALRSMSGGVALPRRVRYSRIARGIAVLFPLLLNGRVRVRSHVASIR